VQYVPNHGYGLHRLIYRSRSLLPAGAPNRTEIDEIVAQAASDNRATNITGVFLAIDGWFVQALEGPSDMLKAAFDCISTDPRHTAIDLCVVEPIDKRLFGRWAMKQGQSGIPRVVDIGSASAEELLSLLQLATLPVAARAS
jgi:hypothetical protein